MSEPENIRSLIESTVTKLIAELVPAVRILVVEELAAALKHPVHAGIVLTGPATVPPHGLFVTPAPHQAEPAPDVTAEPSESATGMPEASVPTPEVPGRARCSRCGTRGHNARTCNRPAETARPRIGPGAGAPAAKVPVDTGRAQRFADIEASRVARRSAR